MILLENISCTDPGLESEARFSEPNRIKLGLAAHKPWTINILHELVKDREPAKMDQFRRFPLSDSKKSCSKSCSQSYYHNYAR